MFFFTHKALFIPFQGRTLTIPYPTIALWVLGILYAVGVAGISLPIHPDFVYLSPVNLLISLAVVLLFHPQWNWRIIGALVFCYSWGFLAEVFGVNTGLLFGEYWYGAVLGAKLWETPLIIGVNWVLLTYCSTITTNHIVGQGSWLIRTLIAAGLMVLLDICIEPVAIRLDFWQWTAVHPPLQNYFGWFVVALLPAGILSYLLPLIKNKVAVGLFLFQFLFFILLNLL